MSKQASEDKLLKKIDSIMPQCGEIDCTTCTQRHERVLALLRTEKLKLLAEVRERVVGEGDLVDAETLKKLYDKAYSNGYDDKSYENSYNSQDYRSAEDIAPVIAKIRGENEKRFAALNKLEAEL